MRHLMDATSHLLHHEEGESNESKAITEILSYDAGTY